MSPRFETVKVRKLTKVFGATRALAGVSLEFASGRVTSVEGGNGAGKSTLLSVLATLARPTSGEVLYSTKDETLEYPGDQEDIRPGIGLVGHEALVYPDLTARESLTLMAGLYALESPEKAVEAALAGMDLEGVVDRPARTYSRGQLQRLSLARAQLHAPSLLLFDEPTTGLDVHATRRVEGAIREARARGCIVVLVTHDHDFAARVSDVRITLERGRVADRRE